MATGEEGLSAANTDYLKLGQILGADGLLLLDVNKTPQATNLTTRLVAVAHPSIGPDELAVRLRRGCPPVFTRIRQDQVLVDPRTLLDGEEGVLVEAFGAALSSARETEG